MKVILMARDRPSCALKGKMSKVNKQFTRTNVISLSGGGEFKFVLIFIRENNK